MAAYAAAEEAMPALPWWATTSDCVFREMVPVEEASVSCASALFIELCLSEKPEDETALRRIVSELLDFLGVDDVVKEVVGDGLMAKGFPHPPEAESRPIGVGDICIAELAAADNEWHDATVLELHGDGTVTLGFDGFQHSRQRMAVEKIVRVVRDAAAKDGQGSEAARSGRCEICERTMKKLTSHHLIPRSTHDRPLNKDR